MITHDYNALSSGKRDKSNAAYKQNYIPMTAVPVEAFSAALFAGREENGSAPWYLHTVRLIWLLLASLIMANDLHGWMFRITEEANGSLHYAYGPLYFITFGWIVIISAAGFAVLMMRCRLSQCRKFWFVPLLAA